MAALDRSFRPSSLDLNVSKTATILKTGMKNVHFKNWAETFECFPELFFAPKAEEEISDILQLARETNKKVRVVGCKHSPSDIVCTTDIMISLQYFNKLLQIDKNKHQVKVQAGMVLSDLNHILYSHNLALSVLGSISGITVGGAISVATHGSGINYGTISSYVTEMDIMLCNGSIVNLSADRNPDLLLAAACSLGSFGIILNVTLQCEPAFNLLHRQFGLSLKDVIENLDVHLQGSEHFKFLYFPHTDQVVVSHSSRTHLDPPKESWISKTWQWFWDYAVGFCALEFLFYISTFFPHLVPRINRIYYNLLFSGSKSKVDRSYKIFNYDCLFKQFVNEWAIPVENTGLVLWQLKEWIDLTPDIYLHFPVEVRFVKEEDIFLSPAYGRKTCYINILMYRFQEQYFGSDIAFTIFSATASMPKEIEVLFKILFSPEFTGMPANAGGIRPYGKDVPYVEVFTAFEAIMMNAGGRPHWAKAHSVTAETFNLMYPAFGRWCSLRKKLDPINMFLNPYMLRIFNNTESLIR